MDGGDPNATIYRLWSQAKRLLQQPSRRERVVRLTSQLMEVRELTGEQIGQFFHV